MLAVDSRSVVLIESEADVVANELDTTAKLADADVNILDVASSLVALDCID